MGKEIANQVQEAQRVTYRINPRRKMPRYILNYQKLNKKKIIKSSKGKSTNNIQGNPHKVNT